MIDWLWQTFRWTDVIDIGIMAFIIYRALLILRGTRALQTLIGLLLLALLYVLSDRLNFYSVRWLLQSYLKWLFLAVVILFQQDIRRGLARAGGRLFPAFRPTAGVGMVEEMVKASFALASRRIGALIAIEREASLDEWAESGSRIDAEVSDDLLLAIFHPTSPLHDGAVVVRDGRILAAQVFVPLTLSKDVSRFYGTRHRAAMGLTEETDAVVVIVSEERGTVALVEGGEIKPVSDANALRQALQETFQERKGDE